MNHWNIAGRHEILEIHETRDRQPAFHARRPRYIESLAAALEIAHPQIKLHAQPYVQGHKRPLHQVPDPLRSILEQAAH